MTQQEILNLALMLSPIVLVQLGVAVYALLDLRRRARVRGPRWAWAIGLVITALALPSGLLISGLYLAWGRHTEAMEQDHDRD